MTVALSGVSIAPTDVAKVRVHRHQENNQTRYAAFLPSLEGGRPERLTRWTSMRTIDKFMRGLVEARKPPMLRECMCCKVRFRSFGVGNRLCVDCRRKTLSIFDN